MALADSSHVNLDGQIDEQTTREICTLLNNAQPNCDKPYTDRDSCKLEPTGDKESIYGKVSKFSKECKKADQYYKGQKDKFPECEKKELCYCDFRDVKSQPTYDTDFQCICTTEPKDNSSCNCSGIGRINCRYARPTNESDSNYWCHDTKQSITLIDTSLDCPSVGIYPKELMEWRSKTYLSALARANQMSAEYAGHGYGSNALGQFGAYSGMAAPQSSSNGLEAKLILYPTILPIVSLLGYFMYKFIKNKKSTPKTNKDYEQI